jgi:hypothetical protein
LEEANALLPYPTGQLANNATNNPIFLEFTGQRASKETNNLPAEPIFDMLRSEQELNDYEIGIIQ